MIRALKLCSDGMVLLVRLSHCAVLASLYHDTVSSEALSEDSLWTLCTVVLDILTPRDGSFHVTFPRNTPFTT